MVVLRPVYTRDMSPPRSEVTIVLCDLTLCCVQESVGEVSSAASTCFADGDTEPQYRDIDEGRCFRSATG